MIIERTATGFKVTETIVTEYTLAEVRDMLKVTNQRLLDAREDRDRIKAVLDSDPTVTQ